MDLATTCYEYACGKYPNNMDHMMGLFNCYVREYSFVKQQQVGAFTFLFSFFFYWFFGMLSNLLVYIWLLAIELFLHIVILFWWQTAIKMYKHAGEERFLLWAVCSIQLQVLPISVLHILSRMCPLLCYH